MSPYALRRADFVRLTRTALVITACWLLAGFLFGSQHHRMLVAAGQEESFRERMIGMSASMMVWALFTPFILYVSELLPLRKPRRLRNAILLIGFAMLVAAIRASFDGWLPLLLEGLPMSIADYRASVLALLHTHVMMAVIVVGIGNFLRLERDDAARQRAQARLEAELSEARLRQLRADLHPHFLFNTLNAVAALLHDDPVAAEQMLERLRELLRASVASEESREVPLAQELEFIARYFDIQKMRFGEKLKTAIRIAEPRLKNAAVPPLLLQPLVENSILHGVARRRDGGAVAVDVDAIRDGRGDWLRLQVSDNGPGCTSDAIFAGSSVGVPNAVARLESIYGSEQSLRYERRGEAFVAEVRIPLKVVA